MFCASFEWKGVGGGGLNLANSIISTTFYWTSRKKKDASFDKLSKMRRVQDLDQSYGVVFRLYKKYRKKCKIENTMHSILKYTGRLSILSRCVALP